MNLAGPLAAAHRPAPSPLLHPRYEAVYETIGEEADYSYIKLFNMSSRVLVSGVYGATAQSVLPYLMAIHIGPRPVWLVRAGEGVGLRTSKTHSSIGSPLAQLTDSGKAFAEVLADYVRDQVRSARAFTVPGGRVLTRARAASSPPLPPGPSSSAASASSMRSPRRSRAATRAS